MSRVPDVPNPPARNALDRFIRQFNYTAYVIAILFLYAVAATALGMALAPALLAFQVLRSIGETWPALGRFAWLERAWASASSCSASRS